MKLTAVHPSPVLPVWTFCKDQVKFRQHTDCLSPTYTIVQLSISVIRDWSLFTGSEVLPLQKWAEVEARGSDDRWKMSGSLPATLAASDWSVIIISTLPFSLTGSRGEYLRVVGIHSDG